MVDFIRLRIEKPDISAIRSNVLLEWQETTNEKTGEIIECKAEYNGLTFRIIVNKYCYIAGSLHKFWNIINGSGLQNYNDFSLPDLSLIIQNICTSFDLVPDNCIIENIEFGVNIISPIPVYQVIQAVINHKLKPFTREYSEKKRFRECEHYQYIIKVYDKGLQFDQSENILRVEVKVLKMDFLKKKNIRINSLSDLSDLQKLSELGRELRDNFNEILFYGIGISSDNLPNRERIVLIEGQLAQYWVDLKNSDRNLYNKRRVRFIDLVHKYTTFDIPLNVGNAITEKWNELQTRTPQTLHNMTGGINSDNTQYDRSSIGSYCVNLDINNQTLCKVCGKDLAGRKPGIKFCSKKCKNDFTNKLLNPRNNLLARLKRIENAGNVIFQDKEFIYLDEYQKTILQNRNSIYNQLHNSGS